MAASAIFSLWLFFVSNVQVLARDLHGLFHFKTRRAGFLDEGQRAVALRTEGHSGDKIGLYKSDPPPVAPQPDAGFVPYVLVEEIHYSSQAPWPSGADGTGFSLQRQTLTAYGNDPANWFTAAPTPGQTNTSAPADANGDGLPDAWQIQYFGSITDPNAAPTADPDGDGMTNLQEYLAGTDPRDPQSNLRVVFEQSAGDGFKIRFNGMAGKTYEIQYRDSLTTGVWLTLRQVAPSSSGVSEVTDATASGENERFYRVLLVR